MEERRELAKYVMDERGLSERQACRTVNLHRCTYRYQAKKTDDHEIVQELQHLAESQPPWGCRKMTDYLRNQGHGWNHKRIRRVYRDLALKLCTENQRNGWLPGLHWHPKCQCSPT